MTATFELDDDQAAVAEIEAGVRQVVLAPAGSGKTETVAAMIQHLVEEEGVGASQEVMVLSFSRAAVTAIRRRLVGVDSGLRAVSVRTLDALASRIISTMEDADDPAGSFDARIIQATKLLRAGAVSDELEVVEHIVVDEVQDVVGVRAAFVLEILSVTSNHAGFTVLGDPQQAIYNFQLTDKSQMTSDQFLGFLDQKFAPRQRELRANYRARSNDARRFAELGGKLGGKLERDRIAAVRSELAGVLVAGSVGECARHLSRWSGTTAFLCRTNGIALRVRDELRSSEILAALQSSAEQRGVAEWVSRTIDGDARRIKRAEFLERWDAGSTGRSGADAWRLLKRAERNFAKGDVLDVQRLSRAVAVRDVPAELMEPAAAQVVVSTVHRSKGLEFDNVVLVNSGSWLPGDASNDDASAAYVALTRARDRIVSARVDEDRYLRLDKKSDRWIIGGFKPAYTFGFELRPSDTRDVADPARAPVVAEYLRAETRTGDAVDLRLNRRSSTPERPVYDVMHGETRIGVTTDGFGFSMKNRLGRLRPGARWPGLSGLRIDGYETRGCGPDAAAPGVADLWSGVLVTGMAKLNWNGEDL